ncbi:putative OPT family oligopeptide transporter [Sphingomonas kaistensis]|uniref:Putative OPT family oligopeptide transporter n=1 Tax=Sphingomonas kaistensis TaxID=298708 RepID=A0A7X5Y3B0_9SPHN|nr:oligopeptide transporter, OPT family [Sphingomonas kaistensis]NJC04354.1 putative OPT family oligopeptide transporter [Sphingomonas kaistensis]
MRELTLRGILLGAVLTLLFTAANVYLGLKIGLTFATSIPAAVISMAVLKAFRDTTIQENNIVQTIASAAGTLSAIIFVLPGLVMIGWWTGFPYWLSVAVIAIGGVLGVMYSVPLRRALVTGSDLPYPEGVAAAEVLKVGAGVGGAEENRKGLGAIILSSLVSAGYALATQLKLVTAEAARTVSVGAGGTTLSGSLSLALIGVGHLVGLGVGIAMVVGLVISWGVLVPWLTALTPAAAGVELGDHVGAIFRSEVRFIGAGTIGVAAIWTLLKILPAIGRGISGALAASRQREGGGQESLPLTERDIPIKLIGISILLLMLPIAGLLAYFVSGTDLHTHVAALIGFSLAYILVAGIIIASVCGYMAGLIGASNSPISGVGILAVLGISLILAALFGGDLTPQMTQTLVAFALFVTAVVFGIATISNDNLQDLKTGQLVGATPWRQQVALVLGVLFGALVIPPILDLLNGAFGFQGAPGAGENALAAPQAALISAIAQGVLGGNLRWDLIGIGAGIGAVVIVIDELLRRTGKRSLPPLAVGMGIYLPMALTLLIPIGALLGHLYNRWAERSGNYEVKERLGVLMATGLIVGESLFGVAFAGAVAATDDDTPLSLFPDGFEPSVLLSIAAFVSAVLFLYHSTRRSAATLPTVPSEPGIPDEATYR